LDKKTTKGGLILEIFSLWLKSPKKGAKNYPDHFHLKKDNQDKFWNLFWRFEPT